ncbi:integral membrane protein, YkoY family [Salinibacillus kushneri]|uniref:Integral membrane protein, YkoY family n=1 Tax=Salinibacillus kushneri TaxID=237682 RepID=A0A1H9Z697_9BACI|nr:TerC family protein [Salinibacillus kushneri]SES76880.1 integral membrane protein, YkoY family [Salinibacillus kushneri]
MESIWIEYGWTLLVLIGLEGLLSADNALVLAIIAKHLPGEQKKRAINYGVMFAFVFRFGAIFAISFLANVWQVQALGAAYLIYLGVKHIISGSDEDEDDGKEEVSKGKGFWPTVAKLGFADLAFAIDSILAAVALALALPDSPLPTFGGMDGAKFAVIVLAGVAGLILIKYAATWFVKLLNDRPGLETTAYLIVAWVGVKLGVITLAHEDIGVLPHEFPHGAVWTTIFWSVLLATAIGGWFLSGRKPKEEEEEVKAG